MLLALLVFDDEPDELEPLSEELDDFEESDEEEDEESDSDFFAEESEDDVSEPFDPEPEPTELLEELRLSLR